MRFLYRVDTEDDGFDAVTYLDDVGGLADLLAPGHLADVDEAFDSGGDLDEGAEVRIARDDAADPISEMEALGHGFPGMRLELLQADGDAAFWLGRSRRS